VRVTQADDLASVLAAALRSAGPMLVEIVVA
jgi:thiamine pyrophosphate-dependent acetolactate synthase large subunit-like protein